MSPKQDAPNLSRREMLQTLGVAGAALLTPGRTWAQEVTYPNKVWDINGQDAFILADEATQTYYRTSTFGPQVRVSRNLVDWSEPFDVWTQPPAAERWFSNAFPWACEIHPYNGRYYLFQTRHNNNTTIATSELASTPDPYSIWHSQWARATVIAVADSPLGPYVGLDNRRPTHDPRFMTLDGTFIVDEEGPWMVYCHEWLQKMDGTIEAIPLTEDLVSAAGEPILLFRGSDASWRSHPEGSTGSLPVINPQQGQPFVTDGCQFRWTPSGYLLMIWSGPGGIYSYNELQAISRSGRVRGPWEQVYREPFIHGNRGHGNIFTTFEGQDMLVVMNRETTGGRGDGVRSEYYEVEITDDGVKVLRHRDDLDGQVGMSLEDTTPPDLHLPPNQVINATSPAGAVLHYTATAHDWRQGPVPLRASQQSGATFPIGNTTVDCSAQDDAGNVASLSFNVHVKGAPEQVDDLAALVRLGRPSDGNFLERLQSVQQSVATGDKSNARTQLGAFADSVEAQSGRAFSISLARRLVDAATRIMAVLVD